MKAYIQDAWRQAVRGHRETSTSSATSRDQPTGQSMDTQVHCRSHTPSGLNICSFVRAHIIVISVVCH